MPIGRTLSLSLAACIALLAALPCRGDDPGTWTSGDYVYDGAGNIVQIGTSVFVYDASSRLREATIPAGVENRLESYQYDPFGNMQRRFVNGNEIGIGATSQTTNRMNLNEYDDAGNVVGVAGNVFKSYSYDPLQRMVEKDWNQLSSEIYIYTPGEERIGAARTIGAVTTWTWTVRHLDGKPIRQFSSSESSGWRWLEDYVWTEGALIGGERAVGEGGRRHFHLDHLGTPRLITSNERSLVARHDFAPFGAELTPSVQEPLREEPLRFTAHERDFEDILYLDYMHARYYSASDGRFLSADPLAGDLGNPQSLNRYSYVLNEPVSYLDPQGLLNWKFWQWFRKPRLPKAKNDKCYECWILGVKPDITVYGKHPDPVTPQYSLIRVIERPDYLTFTWGAGYWMGGSGHVSIDRWARVSWGVAGGLQTPGATGSLMLGRLDRDNATPKQVEDVMSQFAWNVSGGVVAGVGRSYVGDIFLGFNGRNAATEVGAVFFPGVGISYGYTWGPKDTLLTKYLPH